MIANVAHILVERMLWNSVMGIGQFIYDYQTLITGVCALVAAYVATRPVYRQLDLLQTQSNGVLREMLLHRQMEIEQAHAALSKIVVPKLNGLSREFDSYEEDEDFKLNEHQAHHHDISISSAAHWLRQSYRWRDNADTETKKEKLLEELDKLLSILQDVHYPAHHDQHGEDYSMTDEEYAAFTARGKDAKDDIYPALEVAEGALKSFQTSLVDEIDSIVSQLKKLDRALVAVD